MTEFKLGESEYIELNNLLKVLGLCGTGGMANTAISAGLVTVDGKVELRKRAKIRAGSQVAFEGKTINVR